jgi:hypothetical protein
MWDGAILAGAIQVESLVLKAIISNFPVHGIRRHGNRHRLQITELGSTESVQGISILQLKSLIVKQGHFITGDPPEFSGRYLRPYTACIGPEWNHLCIGTSGPYISGGWVTNHWPWHGPVFLEGKILR